MRRLTADFIDFKKQWVKVVEIIGEKTDKDGKHIGTIVKDLTSGDIHLFGDVKAWQDALAVLEMERDEIVGRRLLVVCAGKFELSNMYRIEVYELDDGDTVKSAVTFGRKFLADILQAAGKKVVAWKDDSPVIAEDNETLTLPF